MCCLSRSSAPPTEPSASSDARAPVKTCGVGHRRRRNRSSLPTLASGTAARPTPTGPRCFLLWMVVQQEARSVASRVDRHRLPSAYRRPMLPSQAAQSP